MKKKRKLRRWVVVLLETIKAAIIGFVLAVVIVILLFKAHDNAMNKYENIQRQQELERQYNKKHNQGSYIYELKENNQ